MCGLWIGWFVFEKCAPERRTSPKVGGGKQDRGGDRSKETRKEAGSDGKVTQGYSQVVQNNA